MTSGRFVDDPKSLPLFAQLIALELDAGERD